MRDCPSRLLRSSPAHACRVGSAAPENTRRPRASRRRLAPVHAVDVCLPAVADARAASRLSRSLKAVVGDFHEHVRFFCAGRRGGSGWSRWAARSATSTRASAPCSRRCGRSSARATVPPGAPTCGKAAARSCLQRRGGRDPVQQERAARPELRFLVCSSDEELFDYVAAYHCERELVDTAARVAEVEGPRVGPDGPLRRRLRRCV